MQTCALFPQKNSREGLRDGDSVSVKPHFEHLHFSGGTLHQLSPSHHRLAGDILYIYVYGKPQLDWNSFAYKSDGLRAENIKPEGLVHSPVKKITVFLSISPKMPSVSKMLLGYAGNPAQPWPTNLQSKDTDLEI